MTGHCARLSLLLSLPTITGAGFLKSLDLVRSGDTAPAECCYRYHFIRRACMACHFLDDALAGYGNFDIFGYYRVALEPYFCWGWIKVGEPIIASYETVARTITIKVGWQHEVGTGWRYTQIT